MQDPANELPRINLPRTPVNRAVLMWALAATIAVTEWESEELGEPGAQRCRQLLSSCGIAEKLSLETYDDEVVAAP
jgi:hypothetical protein